MRGGTVGSGPGRLSQPPSAFRADPLPPGEDPVEDQTVPLPADASIPALRAIAERGLGQVLAEAGVGEPTTEVFVLKYHPEQRCTFVAKTKGRVLVVKVFRENPSLLARLFQRFVEAGLATGHAPTVPPMAAFDPNLCLIATEWLDGRPLGELIAGGSGRRAGEIAAEWLLTSRASNITLGDRYGPETHLRDADRWTRVLASRDAALGEAAAAALQGLRKRVPRGVPYGLAHGSFYPSHVLDLGSGPGVIDWDDFTRASMALDAGMFCTWVSALAMTGRCPPRQAAETEAAFLGLISEAVDADDLQWHRAIALIKRAKLVAKYQREGWLEHATALLALATL